MTIDQIAYNNNFTKKNPRVKMLLGFALLILSLSINSIYAQAAIAIAVVLVMIFGAKIPARPLFKLYKLPLGFIIISLIAMVLTITKIKENVEYYIIIGRLYVGTNSAALTTAYQTFVRSFACITCTYFMALTIPINQTIMIFKDLHLPRVFVEQFILMYRYINFFMMEFKDMHVAMELKHANDTKWMMIKSSGLMGSKLFIDMLSSYGEWEDALDLKLFDGNFYY